MTHVISEEHEDSSEHFHLLLTGSVLGVYLSTLRDNLDYGQTQVDLGCIHKHCEGHE